MQAPVFRALWSAVGLGWVCGSALGQCTPTPTRICITNPTLFSFAANGVAHGPVTLQRGTSYEFQLVNIPTIHPFIITPQQNGGFGAPLFPGISGIPATGSTLITFNVPMNAPDTLYYECNVHLGLGGPLTIVGGCVADVDDGSGTGTPDGGVTIDDLIFYLGLFEEGDVGADVDDGSGTGTPDGGVTIDDLIYYLTRFEAGC